MTNSTASEPLVLTTDATERLDVFLSRSLPDYSRNFLQKLCHEGNVQVNNIQQTKPGFIVHEGQTVIIALPKINEIHEGELEIIYEDADVLVLNKPAGILTHAKGPVSDEFTVADFVRTRTTDGLETNRPGIVHRLDRATSGVIATAKNPDAKRWLQKQFSERKVKKTYFALVEGVPKENSALIRLPIERNPKQPQTFRVGGNGKPAETMYETLSTYGKRALLRLTPHTGRTHQLRVHMAYLHCPIVGDPLYGTPDAKLGRMFLHAAKLELTLPSRERKVFNAPLPPDLQQYIDSL